MITHHQKNIIDRMKAGACLCVEHTEEGPKYFFSNGGWRPNALAVKGLVNMAIISPNNDGMFGDHQSYELMFEPGVGVVERG